MALTIKDTQKIAKLARIRMGSDELEHFTKEINGILHWIDQLQEVDTDGVAQMTSVADMTLPYRRDEVSDGNIQQQVLANAPMADYGCFVVPKVIE